MNSNSLDPSVRYCGHIFTQEQIDGIRRLIAQNPRSSRHKLSHAVCDLVGWVRPDGGPKDMSCRVAMLRMHRDGLIQLPLSRRNRLNNQTRPRITSASDPKPPITMSADALGQLTVIIVSNPLHAALWNELIERYHYLGHKRLPGAQLRYLVFSGPHLLALLGFGAAAWKVAPRDRFIGWTSQQRLHNLHLVVNNARFLILPWVTSRNLASRILAAVARRLSADWQTRYNYQPVLLETFVQQNRFRGTCYKAANWICVGQTQGRGKLDRYKEYLLPVKDIFLYPLRKDFRQKLCSS